MPPLPLDEKSRLERLRILGLLDRDPIDQLDRLTRLITRHFSLPIAMVSLTDVNRQWFLARTGVTLREISREHSFCGHAILRPDIMQVPDARLDPRFADNPLVTGEPHVVFCAGRPLRALDGVVLGTLCLVDQHPRQLDQAQCQDLDDFGRLVENTLHDLKRRHQVRSLNQILEDKEHLFTLTFNQSSVGMALSSLEGLWLRANPGLEQHRYANALTHCRKQWCSCIGPMPPCTGPNRPVRDASYSTSDSCFRNAKRRPEGRLFHTRRDYLSPSRTESSAISIMSLKVS
nr:GAF domain-containing protein [Aeromonas enteropelogenes]